jgi:hypothetical protein
MKSGYRKHRFYHCDICKKSNSNKVLEQVWRLSNGRYEKWTCHDPHAVCVWVHGQCWLVQNEQYEQAETAEKREIERNAHLAIKNFWLVSPVERNSLYVSSLPPQDKTND